MSKPLLLSFYFYGSILLLPLFAGAFWWSLRARRLPRRIGAGILAVVLAAGIYARFVEPRLLFTGTHEVTLCSGRDTGPVRMAVVSDFHWGVFRNAVGPERIVRRLNELAPDIVVMPGDFTNWIAPDRIASTLAPLGGIDAPVYAVLGNHDVGKPGPIYGDTLTEAIRAAGLTLLMKERRTIDVNGVTLELAGLREGTGPRWQAAGDATLKPVDPNGPPFIIIEHVPVFVRAKRVRGFDLYIAGHTHGGQVRLPFITCRVTFACRVQRYGLAHTPKGQLFVTSGTGMVGLPLRFAVPPRIDMLELSVEPCKGAVRERQGA